MSVAASVAEPQEIQGVARGLIAPPPLFPGQEALLLRSCVLAGQSAVLCAPTGAGKSLVAELALARAVQAGGTAMWLTTTRAQAREVAGRLSALLGPAGFRVIASTRDDRTGDVDILSGRADVVVTVYEKARALLLRSPALRRAARLVVADEVHVLEDDDRGPAVGLLFALWLAGPSAPQVIALTSSPAAGRAAAAALGIALHEDTTRPEPLRLGDLDPATGVVRWNDPESRASGSLDLGTWSAEAPLDGLRRAVTMLPRPVLIFAATRAEAAHVARALAAPASDRSPDQELWNYEDAALGELLAARVGLHTAALSRAQRLRVESALRGGALDVCVATSTLAEGVNLGCRTVLVLPAAASLATPAELANLLGRAGRPGAGPGLGLVVRPEPDSPQPMRPVPTPDPATALRQIAFALAWNGALPAGRIAELLPGLRPEDLSRAMDMGASHGLWRVTPAGDAALLPPGRIAAQGTADPAAVTGWRTMLRRFRAEGGQAALLLVALGGGATCESIPLHRHERQSARWPIQLRVELARDPSPLARYLGEFLEDEASLPRRIHQAAKGVLMHLAARRGESLAAIAREFLSPPGIAEEFLLQAGAVLSQFGELAAEMESPVAEEYLRASAPERHAEPPAEPAVARPTRNGATPVPPCGIAPCLVFLEGSTGLVRLHGNEVRLTRNQYRLLEILARNAGNGLPYERLEAYVWPDAHVERQQVSYHRRQLQERLRRAAGSRAEPLIETLQTWGLRLCLDRAEIEFRKPHAHLVLEGRARVIPINSIAGEIRV